MCQKSIQTINSPSPIHNKTEGSILTETNPRHHHASCHVAPTDFPSEQVLTRLTKSKSYMLHRVTWTFSTVVASLHSTSLHFMKGWKITQNKNSLILNRRQHSIIYKLKINFLTPTRTSLPRQFVWPNYRIPQLVPHQCRPPTPH